MPLNKCINEKIKRLQGIQSRDCIFACTVTRMMVVPLNMTVSKTVNTDNKCME